jgi:protein-disulfide isomerase
MLRSRKLLAIAIGMGLSLVATPRHAAAGDDGSTVVAEVGGHKITLADLDQQEAAKLLQARYKYYLAQRDALDQLIDDQLLRLQAGRENVSVEELLKRHVESQIKEPTEEQLRFVYDTVATDQPYEAVRDKLLETARQLRLKKARTSYLELLRSEYGVVVELSQPSAEVATENSPRRGPENAPVQVVEFADYQCPYCQKINPDLSKLLEDFGSKVAVVFKDFPLPAHPAAKKAAEAARCAGAQGKFWEFHDALFQNKKLEVAELKEQARAFHLDAASFDKCLDTGEQSGAVQKDVNQGQYLGLTGTPSFFVNGHFLSGAVGYRKLREQVEQELTVSPPPKQAALLPQPKESAQK